MTTGSAHVQRWQVNIIRAVAAVVRWIIEPSPKVELKQRRRIRMLSVFLLIMSVYTAAGMVILKKIGGDTWLVLEAASATLFVGYLVSRTRYYRAALAVAIAVPALPPLAIAYFKPPEVNLTAELMWLALPLIVATLMLSLRQIIIVVTFYISFIIALRVFGLMEFSDIAPVLGFLSIITFFVIAISVIRRKDQTEIENQLIELQHAEQLLSENNEQLDTVLNSVPCGIIVVDEETHTIHDVNTYASNLIGAPGEEIIGKECHRFICPAERGKCPITDLGEPAAISEQVLVNSRGISVPILKNVARVTMKGSRYLLETFVDITELKQMEKALKESEEKFSKAFQASPDAISISRLSDGAFLDINDGFTRIIGYSREELVGQNADNFNIWADAGQRENMLRKVRDHILMHNEEMQLRPKAGEIRTMLLSTEYVQIGDEPCLLVVGTDITERKKMQEALVIEATRRSILTEQSRDGIVILDQNGAVYEANRQFAEMLGYTSEEILKLNVWDWEFLYPPEQVREMIRTVDEAGDHFQTRHRRKDGTTYDVEISTNGAMFGGQKLIFCVCRDITERKKTEEQLKEAMANLEQSSSRLAATNKELETFSYSVSHDLRAPLRSIDGFSQALLEDYRERLDEKGQDYLRRLRGASQKMGELIDGILKLSRLTRSEMHHEPINLSALAREIAGRLQETQPKRKVKFLIDKELTGSGDPQLLRVLLENLLGNAWKFTSKQPQARIEFSMERNNGKKAYFIRDNGAGFDMTYADKLFGAFQRLHDVSEFPGTGIGLATVQRIINRHGGSIWAEGAVGKGATFHFTLD
jgi:PAS domain S-box-containing protein